MGDETWLTVVWVLVLLVIGYLVVDLVFSARPSRGGKLRQKQRRRKRSRGAGYEPNDQGGGPAGAQVDETPF